MRINFLEELLAEWYEYRGYFVRRNVLVGKMPKGGHECELDVVAFNAQKKHLVQLEPSMDSNSWKKREERYLKKFEAGRKYIPDLFKGFMAEEKIEIEQIAVLVLASKAKHVELGGGKIKLAREFLQEIFQEIKDKKLAKSAIPEHLTILRSFQFVAEFQKEVINVLRND